MKRLKVVLALALALGIMVTISVAPALANNNNNNDNRLERKDLQLDKKILRELRDDNNGDCCGFNRFNNFDHDDLDCCDNDLFDHDDIDDIDFRFINFSDDCGHWEWSWVFHRWDWEEDCD